MLKYVAEVLQAESLVFKDLIGMSSFFCCLTFKKCFMLLNTRTEDFLPAGFTVLLL